MLSYSYDNCNFKSRYPRRYASWLELWDRAMKNENDSDNYNDNNINHCKFRVRSEFTKYENIFGRLSFLITRMAHVRWGPFIPHTLYYGNWYHGPVKTPSISRHVIELGHHEYSGLSAFNIQNDQETKVKDWIMTIRLCFPSRHLNLIPKFKIFDHFKRRLPLAYHVYVVWSRYWVFKLIKSVIFPRMNDDTKMVNSGFL